MVKLIALLALVAAATATVDGTSLPRPSFLKFDKTSLNLQGNIVGEKLRVSLNEKPTDNVVVYLEAPSTRFDKCSLTFTPNNFDKPQELTVVSLPFLTQAPTARQVPIKFTAFTEDCSPTLHNKSVDFPTTRSPEGSGQCQVTGDPHYKSFDTNAQYHYMGVGDYYLVKSDTLIIQARQGKCMGKASCIHALAIRYGGASFMLDANDNNPNTCTKTITNLNGVVISRTRSGQVTTVNVALNAGSNIKVDIFGSGDTRFLNVYVNLANHLKGKVNGLCGRFDGDTNNDFSTPDGKPFTNQQIINQSAGDMFGQAAGYQQSALFQYGESWRVADNENLFKCRDNCPGLASIKDPLPGPVAECQIPKVVPTCENRRTTSLTTATSSITSSNTVLPITSSTILSSTTPLTTSSATSSASPFSSTTLISSTTSPVNSSTQGPGTSTNGQGTTSTNSQGTTSTNGQGTTSTNGQGTTSTNGSTTSTTSGSPSSSGNGNSASSTTTGGNGSITATSLSTSLTTTAKPSSTTTNSVQPTVNPNNRPIILPLPIIIIPIPVGFFRARDLPRYRDEPTLPAVPALPDAPRQVLDAAKRGCATKITRIDECGVDVNLFIRACEADIEGQMNPELAYDVHRDAYTDVCSAIIIDKSREPILAIAQRARAALKKYCFGNQPCDSQCLQCSSRGCLECKDRNRFEVHAGRCVPRQRVAFEEKFFSDRPKYRALTDGEIAPQISELGDNVDPAFNPMALVETDSVKVAVSEDPVKAQAEEDKKKAEAGKNNRQSSAMRLAISSIAGVVALAVSLMF